MTTGTFPNLSLLLPELTSDGLLDGSDLLGGELQYGREDGHEAQLLVRPGQRDELQWKKM